ncbi:MAG: DNA translocase FtsK 4TM domain-containing protein, partial [Aestuariivirga sp.]
MAYDPSYDTDDSAVPHAVRVFFKKRLYEVVGLAVFTVLIGAGVALATWSADDPSLNNAIDGTASNWLGYPGAVLADQLMQFFGLGVLPLMAIPMAWAVRFMGHQGMIRPIRSVFSWLFTCLCASATLAALPAPSSWSLASGLG